MSNSLVKNSKITKSINEGKLLNQKDLIIIGILMFVFTVLVFLRLGNTYAPNTTYETTTEKRDLILDFGDYINVGELYVYLGNYDNRTITISAFNEVTGEWEIMRPDVKIESVFKWNKIDVNCFGRYFGLVCTDDMGSFNEFVFFNDEGQRIYPVNMEDYPTLFDEQNMFPENDGISYMNGTYFDEIYYARTGYEFIHHLPTYETTHPQLGKCIIAFGMLIFGNNPFGWRFFVAVFGILFIPLMYAFAKALFDNTFVAACVGILVTFDCMHYTLSRICTIDTIVAFFIILMYFLMYLYIKADKEYRSNNNWQGDSFPPKKVYTLLMLSGIAMGCAIATKLTGVYAAVGLAVIFIYHTVKNWPKKQSGKMFWFCVIFFILVPLVQYTLPYIPAVEAYAQLGITDKTVTFDENGLNIGYGWTGLIARTLRNTNYMINYHKNLEATHPFMSPAQSWPIIYRTLMAANDNLSVMNSGDGSEVIRSAINYMGNPAIWWMAIPCILVTLVKGIKDKDKKALFLFVAYIAQYIPWFGVNRCIFIYHYYPSLLFSLFMMGYTIKALIDWKEKSKKYVVAYLCIAVVMFFVFFPIISGWPCNSDYGNALEWFETWAFM